jgi:hypothetical protein
MTPLLPAAFRVSTIASASKALGLKIDGSSSPVPHSLSVNVFTVKCRKL